MKNKNYLILVFGIFLIYIFTILAVSSTDDSSIKLLKGKNNMFLNTNQIYVKDLVRINPDIEVISYKENNRSIGYVNLFDGIGDNFLINRSIEYEIIVRQDTNLVLPGAIR